MNDPGREANQRELVSRWVHDHGRSVLGYLVGLVRDRSAAEDLLQDVFCRAWQARHRYVDTGRERAYLLRIADRLACDRARRPRKVMPASDEGIRPLEPVDGERSPWETLLAEEARAQLTSALNMLNEPQRRVLLLRYYGDLGFSEIAEILGAPLNTVLSHNHRALQALRRLLVEKNGS
ncbi:MAG TPA: RNA polymerase sigma factor [Pirellulales bacterium]|nr:RNA polymerase sigma factor [Pirellulales bacterium]